MAQTPIHLPLNLVKWNFPTFPHISWQSTRNGAKKTWKKTLAKASWRSWSCMWRMQRFGFPSCNEALQHMFATVSIDFRWRNDWIWLDEYRFHTCISRKHSRYINAIASGYLWEQTLKGVHPVRAKNWAMPLKMAYIEGAPGIEG